MPGRDGAVLRARLHSFGERVVEVSFGKVQTGNGRLPDGRRPLNWGLRRSVLIQNTILGRMDERDQTEIPMLSCTRVQEASCHVLNINDPFRLDNSMCTSTTDMADVNANVDMNVLSDAVVPCTPDAADMEDVDVFGLDSFLEETKVGRTNTQIRKRKASEGIDPIALLPPSKRRFTVECATAAASSNGLMTLPVVVHI